MKRSKRDKIKKQIAIATPLWSFPDIFPSIRDYIVKLEGEGLTWYYTLKTPVTPARNNLIKNIYNNGFKYTFFIDDDNVPIKDNALDIMLDMDKDIVTGWVRKKTEPTVLCLKERKEKENGWEYISYDKPFTGKVDLAGSGFMLIKRKVIKAMFEKYPMPFERSFVKYLKTDKGFEEIGYATGKPILNDQGKITLFQREFSSDYLFCERAIGLGFEVWTDKRLKCDHYNKDMKGSITKVSV